MRNARIVFIGCGNMGSSLIGGLIANGCANDKLRGVETDTKQAAIIASRFDIDVLENSDVAIENADVVVLAVKPNAIKNIITPIATKLQQYRPLLLSVAAGIRLSNLEKWAGHDLPIVRIMPNTPVLVQAGASALYANIHTNDEQRDLAEAIMRSVGTVLWLENEALMDIVTALSGSGPAYYFLVMEIMEKVAVQLGLPVEQARMLTLQTTFGAAKMALESTENTTTLRQQVTSTGGTTEKALQVLMDGNLEQLFQNALHAAHQRSIEMADTLKNT